MDEDGSNIGPAMAKLTPKQRAFVRVCLEYPGITQAKAAELAGYAQSTHNGMKVSGWRAWHDPDVQEAIREQGGRKLHSLTIMAANALGQLMERADLDPAVLLKASLAVLDRTGFAAQQNINVNKTVTDQSGKAIMERIRALAEKHGLDAQKLLGKPVVELEVVKDETERSGT